MTELSLSATLVGPTFGRMSLGSRAPAAALRQKLEAALDAQETVTIDFEGIEATQSFVDELVGMLVLKRGPSVLQSLKFRRCSNDMKSIVQFVLRDRAAQFTSQTAQAQSKFAVAC